MVYLGEGKRVYLSLYSTFHCRKGKEEEMFGFMVALVQGREESTIVLRCEGSILGVVLWSTLLLSYTGASIL